MKKKMMITCTVVLVTAAVILGFVLKNQVRENPDKNTVNVATANSPLADYPGYLLNYEDPYGAGRIQMIW